MKEYKTIGVVDVNCGYIGLTKEQAAVRIDRLKKVKGDIYEVTGPLQFKAGEVIRLEGADKYMTRLVIDLDAEKEAAAAREKQLAEADAKHDKEQAAAEAKANKGGA